MALSVPRTNTCSVLPTTVAAGPDGVAPPPGTAAQPLHCGPVVQVGSPGWAGTLTASHAAFTVLNWVQLPGNRFLAACRVQVRYLRYELAVVFISIEIGRAHV